jgi:ribosome-binding factor A
MTTHRRIERINSLLKEVIIETIRSDVKHAQVPELITITAVETSRDLHYAKVHVSIIENDPVVKEGYIEKLNAISGLIGSLSSKKVNLRYFPSLTFLLDTSIDSYMKIDQLLQKINEDREDETSQNDL